MFWHHLGNAVKLTRSLQKIIVATAATTLISVGMYDYLKQRNKEAKRRDHGSRS